MRDFGAFLGFKGPKSSRSQGAKTPPQSKTPPREGNDLTLSYWILPWQIPSTITFHLSTPHGGLSHSLAYFNIEYATCFVRQQVGDASKLFRYGARPHHRPRNLRVFLNHPTENHLSHIQIDTQTTSNKKQKISAF